MWRRAKEKTLAQDFNPNHLPTGSPDSTGGRFTTEENASLSVPPSAKVTEKQSSPKSDMPKKAESDRSYLKDAIYPAPDFSDFLPTPSTASLKILKGLKLAYGFSEETLAFFAKFLAEEEAKKALAGAPKNVLKEEKTLSNFFEKKGKASSPKEHVNKYADKSKANPQTSVEKAKLEREALSKIDLRLPKPSKELFESYEK
ncbi:hypothetical protein FAI41_02500 [Acetobacteraceae bacterium]|nr:hypothetical protein FAI41_02500 [Acetobacteraceae bacterium]